MRKCVSPQGKKTQHWTWKMNCDEESVRCPVNATTTMARHAKWQMVVLVCHRIVIYCNVLEFGFVINHPCGFMPCFKYNVSHRLHFNPLYGWLSTTSVGTLNAKLKQQTCTHAHILTHLNYDTMTEASANV